MEKYNFPAEIKVCKKFETNNKTISPNVSNNMEEVRQQYISKYNLKCENKVILQMITDYGKWRHLALNFACIIKRNNIEALWRLLL